MDFITPDLDAMDAIGGLKKSHPDVKIISISANPLLRTRRGFNRCRSHLRCRRAEL
jgi:hypothetical protein